MKEFSIGRGFAVNMDDGLFYEIEIDPPSVNAPPPQKIMPVQKDPIREKFLEMRAIARQTAPTFGRDSDIFNEHSRRKNGRLFYKQAVFMEDFEDGFAEQIPFSAYYPHYQMMGYEQLRHYFTWRTRLRAGTVAETSLSYVFLYMYELLNNVGVSDSQGGLQKLCAFWRAYRAFDENIDKYVFRWLKDYHIYYPLPHTFRDFVAENALEAQYPGLADDGDFALFCSVSKYDIGKSPFFSSGALAEGFAVSCFCYVLEQLRVAFQQAGLRFDDAVFQPTTGLSPWLPFRDALFHHRLRQPDRRVVFSEKEIYICKNSNWSFSTGITMTSGRQLVGYVMRQMEATLRGVVKYKHKLSADINAVDPALRKKLAAKGAPLEDLVHGATMKYYREATKTVVRVRVDTLEKIRREALQTQEKLVVEELPLPAPILPAPPPKPPPPAADGWAQLREALGANELLALAAALNDADGLQRFAGESGIMAEVLADSINEKAADLVGDSILDDDFTVYDDYAEFVKGMVG